MGNKKRLCEKLCMGSGLLSTTLQNTTIQGGMTLPWLGINKDFENPLGAVSYGYHNIVGKQNFANYNTSTSSVENKTILLLLHIIILQTMKEYAEELSDLSYYFIMPGLKLLRDNMHEIIPTVDSAMVMSYFNLLQFRIGPMAGRDGKAPPSLHFQRLIRELAYSIPTLL